MKDAESRRGTVRGRRVRAMLALALAAAALGACRAHTTAARQDTDAAARVILVSLDALNEERLRAAHDPERVPALLGAFDDGACAVHSVSAFPTLTAPSHAALWTGAFGDVTGATANWQPRLPRDEHRLDDVVSGFSAEVLRAEPLWITAARAGRRVVGHHVTQAPQPPGYHPERSRQGDPYAARRADAARVLGGADIAVLNGYNRLVARHRVFNRDSIAPRTAAGWRNLDEVGAGGVEPLEIAWEVAGDSIFALFTGSGAYDRVVVAAERDAARGVVARAAPAEVEPVRGRPLARHFSDALPLRVDDGTVFVRARLFQLEPDASDYLLYIPALYVAEANRADVQASYDAAVRGWIGNAPLRELQRGAFGPLRIGGGDGTAEARYLEAAELKTRQFMRGSQWAWDTRRAELLLDYFPLGDSMDHAFYGYLDPEWPDYDAEVAEQVRLLRDRAWDMVDLRLEHLRELATREPGGVLLVTGDHGMRTSWRVFRPNAMLREAGLLALDDEGSIDLTRTRALSPNGYWISVNRVAWQGGVVTPEEEAEVVAAAERALHAARDAEGRPIVTAVYRAGEHPELGIGGATGGDLYYGTAAGIRWSPAADGEVITPASIHAGHGYPSTDRDMWTAFCALGAGLRAGRIPAIRATDVAPTVAEALGVPAPPDAVGRSVWPQLRGAPER